MKPLALLFVLAPAGALFAQYTYYYSDTLTSIDTTKWSVGGSPSAGSGGLTGTGSLISSLALPTGNEYEVKTTVKPGPSGGTFMQYLRASPDAANGLSV